ncbi:MAG: phospholipase/carboxylesterase [Actinomycetota bacterium]|jgi:phospholipase/carboxylesterase|nr:phospholipase/carboxylesterase [Actinomycetota bacterium]
MNLDAAAVIWSAPERERAGRPLLVLLHGYASHEGDLFQLSPRLPLAPVIASVRAPIPENGGWAWFSFAERGVTDPSAAEVDEATNAFLEWLDAQDFTSVSLLGFSQGAVVALQAMRARPERFRSVVAISGFVAAGESAGDGQLADLRPPVFWGRGTLDRIIPSTAIERTTDWLPAHSTPTIRIYENVAHSLSSAELTDITEFLTTHE